MFKRHSSTPLHRRQPQIGAAAAPIGPILQRQRSAVRFGDLAAEDEADAGSARLCREERHEQVRGIRQARSLIVDPELEAAALALPADGDAAAGLQRRVRRVVHEVDEELLELIGIGADRDVRALLDPDRQPRLDAGDAPYEREQPSRISSRASIDPRLPAIDLIGVSELLIS